MYLTKALAASVGAALIAMGDFIVPSQAPFMTVHSVELSAGQVTADREFHRDVVTVADWNVVVVDVIKDGPSCWTHAGPNPHEGWSQYPPTDRAASEMSLSTWVGHEGCEARLVSGSTYTMLMTWAPRDGSPVVTFAHEFLWKGDDV
jgi:hypothetical protein